MLVMLAVAKALWHDESLIYSQRFDFNLKCSGDCDLHLNNQQGLRYHQRDPSGCPPLDSDPCLVILVFGSPYDGFRVVSRGGPLILVSPSSSNPMVRRREKSSNVMAKAISLIAPS